MRRAIIAFISIAFTFVVGARTVRAADVQLSPAQEEIHDADLVNAGNGEWEVHTKGSDPYIFLKTNGQPINLQSTPILSFEYFCPSGVGPIRIFVGSVVDVPHMIELPSLSRSESWAKSAIDLSATQEVPSGAVTSLRITLGNRAGTTVRIRAFHMRPPTAQELRLSQHRAESLAQDQQHTKRLTAYLQATFPDQISSISADDQHLRIEGKISRRAAGKFLAEVPMWEDVTDLEAPKALISLSPDRTGHFIIRVSRKEAGKDRLLSGWSIVTKANQVYQLNSALHYVDEVKPRANLPAAHPASLKGIGGFPFTSQYTDIEDLRIASVTLNVILTDIIFGNPAKGRVPYSYDGRTWYIDMDTIKSYDAEMQAIAKRGLMASAILLIRTPQGEPKDLWIRAVAHPDASPNAAYVMPNFTSEAGVEAYAAAMNFVTERYSRPDGKYGRIHHWIMHNEINSGYYWASAGDKTVTTYLDLYQKSMRLTYLLAHQYDSNVKTFISLDHCWTVKPDVRAYAARDLLDLLVKFSHKEGDFAWGIAYHPYPQDIYNPRTWEDSEAKYSFDTPYLTFKNLEVLDAWARQPEVLYKGAEPREIQLSEEGLNSPDYSEKSLGDQAAGLAYAWEKIEPLKTITAFQYHIWADDSGEGGLRLGLRKFEGDRIDPLGKKPAWYIFQAIGTDDWDRVTEFARRIIGVHSWNEVRFKGKIQ